MRKLFSLILLVLCICERAQAERIILTEPIPLNGGEQVTISGWLLRIAENSYVLDPGDNRNLWVVIPLVAPETFRLLESCPIDPDGELCHLTIDAEVYLSGPRLDWRLLITDVRELSIP